VTDEQRIHFLEKTLERIHQAIHATDAKVYSVITLDALLVGALVALLPAPNAWSVVKIVSFAVTAVPITCSICFVLLVAIPRFGGPPGSLLFFRAIKDKPLDHFAVEVRNATTETYLTDLIAQVHRNSEISASKYRYLAFSIVSMMAAIPLWLISVFVLRL